ncbi:hypothetical protein BRE01_67010 [Brevibacillus reuszeri]|uniref:Damage-inducible protein DinB n=1 Tax=Brevibacillus reuszeri TaxID=54915 RepID=A0A0K9YZQ9_9BACL|nr:DinB family protein [Brevibacillus reuszeri]KNB74218.1 hypothetical protein ADS79_03405 [Brevibacillus reuszeri]MED1859616.1 DinB family protein [Brevibacillus reuszeri]GED72999.1 hypothetical protein BRE01_67010 [Brevibacillus reuszeri]
MYTSIDSFVKLWESEARSTQRILEACTDASLQQSVTSDHRTLGRLAWHMVTSVHEMLSRTGLKFDGADPEAPIPATAQEISAAWTKTSDAMVQALHDQWNDSTLQEETDMYGEQWPNGLTLQILIHHMIHHRGQMTVLMRQAGIKVPGIYGPALEDWATFGMEAPTL